MMDMWLFSESKLRTKFDTILKKSKFTLGRTKRTLRIPPVHSITGPDSGFFNNIICSANKSSSDKPIHMNKYYVVGNEN